MKGNYYNENDPYVAEWLRRLIAEGLIPAGYVDDRSILEVVPEDLEGYRQCHFFAGIGGWALALELAGMAEAEGIWTASCPCQPFSTAGKNKGTGDERHLWPVLAALISECQPPRVVGEQVASPSGRAWFDVVSTDLEDMGYAAAAVDLCAAGVGAPHIRQRLFWVGDSDGQDRQRGGSVCVPRRGQDEEGPLLDGTGQDGGVGHSSRQRLRGEPGTRTGAARGPKGEGHQRQRRGLDYGCSGADGSPWSDPAWVYCEDPGGPRWRPVEPGTFPLADGIPTRVGRLRAYGNAIVPQVAAAFLKALPA